jgi:hypothetical protein
MTERIVKEFKGIYGQNAKVWVEKHECTLCGEKKICIVSDGSEGEFDCAWFCPECVKKECDRGLV